MGRVINVLAAIGVLRLFAYLGVPAGLLVVPSLATALLFWVFWFRLRQAPWALQSWRAREAASGALQIAHIGVENTLLAFAGMLLVTWDGTWLVGMLSALCTREAVLRLQVTTYAVGP